MNEWLRNWYGIYPQWLDERTFQFQNETYVIEDCFMNEKQFLHLVEMNQLILSQIRLGGYFPIKNLHGHYISEKKVLFLIRVFAVNESHLLIFQNTLLKSQKTLLDQRDKWIKKVTFVTQRYLYEVDYHEKAFPYIMCLLEYHVGLAKTAISALNDLIFDYPQCMPLNMFCHRRLYALDFKSLMHPMNFIADNRSRDLTGLFLEEELDAEKLMNLFDRLHYTPMELHYFFCRLLYPSWFFDIVEQSYFQDQNAKEQQQVLQTKVENHRVQIRTIHTLLVQKIHLKPLDW